MVEKFRTELFTRHIYAFGSTKSSPGRTFGPCAFHREVTVAGPCHTCLIWGGERNVESWMIAPGMLLSTGRRDLATTRPCMVALAVGFHRPTPGARVLSNCPTRYENRPQPRHLLPLQRVGNLPRPVPCSSGSPLLTLRPMLCRRAVRCPL